MLLVATNDKIEGAVHADDCHQSLDLRNRWCLGFIKVVPYDGAHEYMCTWPGFNV